MKNLPFVSSKINRSHPRAQGLVAAWLLNDTPSSALFRDAAFNLHGTPSGTFTTKKSQFDNSLVFNGGTTSIAFPTVDIASDITCSAWVYITAAASGQSGFIISKSSVNAQWEMFFESGVLKWRGGGINNNVIYSSWPTDLWIRIVGKQVGTTGSLYINGVKVASGTSTAIGNGSEQVFIGAFAISNIASGYFFDGRMADVELHRRGLTDAEIMDDFVNPLSLWDFAKPRREFTSITSGGPLIHGGSLVHGSLIRGGRLAA